VGSLLADGREPGGPVVVPGIHLDAIVEGQDRPRPKADS
jgi:hypothetical protein